MRIYKLKHDLGDFRVYISEQSDKSFHCTVIYYLENNVLDLKAQNFAAASHESVYEQFVEWIKLNLPGEYLITLLQDSTGK